MRDRLGSRDLARGGSWGQTERRLRLSARLGIGVPLCDRGSLTGREQEQGRIEIANAAGTDQGRQTLGRGKSPLEFGFELFERAPHVVADVLESELVRGGVSE